MSTLNIPMPAPSECESSLLGRSAGELVLRVCAGPQAGRILRLSAAKCTIGSAPHCTLRLRGEGIEPVHCLVLNGRRRTIVRRWSDSVRVNDRPIDDGPLACGDRLTIGPVEFQVVSLPQQAPAVERNVRRVDRELVEGRRRLDALAVRLELANRQGRRRLRSAIAKLRKCRQRLAEFDQRKTRFAEEERRLADERNRLTEREAEVQMQLAETQRRRQASAAEERGLTEQAERLREASVRWNQDRYAAEQSINVRRAQLDADAEHLQERLSQAVAEQVRLERQADELRRRECGLADEGKLLDVRLAQLDEQRRGLETLERRLCEQSEECRRRAEQVAMRELAVQKREAEMDGDRAAREAAWTAREAVIVERERAAERRLAELEARQDALERVESESVRRSAAAQGLEREEARVRETSSLLEVEARRLSEHRDAFEADRLRHEAAWAARRDELARLEADLAAKSAVQETERRDAERRAESFRRASDERTAELAAREAEGDRRQAEVERQQAVVTAKCELLKRNWAALCDRERELERRAAENSQHVVVEQENAGAVEREIDAARTERDAARAELASFRMVAETAQMELADARAELQRLQVVAQTAQNELVAAREALAERQHDLERSLLSAAEAEALDSQVAATQTALETATRRLDAVERERDEARDELRRLVEAAPQVDEHEQAVHLRTVERLEAQVRALNEELEFVRGRCEASSQAEKEAIRLQEENEGLRTEMERSREELQSLQGELCELREARRCEESAIHEPSAVAETPEAIVEEPIAAGPMVEVTEVDEPPAEETVAEEAISSVPSDSRTSSSEANAAAATETIPIDVPMTAETPVRTVEPSPSSRAPQGESAADVLRRLGMHAALEEESAEHAPHAPTPDASHSLRASLNMTPEPVPKPAPPAEPDHADGDEQLNAYMSQLMSRLGVNQPPSGPVETKRETKGEAARAAVESQPAPTPAPLAPLNPSEFKARSVAAERKSDLTVLRELANVNARTAIQTHEIRSASDGSKWRALLALTTCGAAAAGGFVWYQGHPLGATLTGVGVVATVLFCSRAFDMKRKARKKSRSLDDVLRTGLPGSAKREAGNP